MKLRIIGEKHTSKEIINCLIEQVPAIFPIRFSLEPYDSGERYTIVQTKVCKYNDTLSKEHEFFDGMTDAENGFWLNIRSLSHRYRPLEEEISVVLVHVNYVDISFESLFLYRLGGVEHTMCAGKKVGNEYNGECRSEERVVVIGIPNSPHINNAKITAHEVAHIFLDQAYTGKITLEQRLAGKVVNHCNNYQSGKRCIMNPPTPATRKSVEEVNVCFCGRCSSKLQWCNREMYKQ